MGLPQEICRRKKLPDLQREGDEGDKCKLKTHASDCDAQPWNEQPLERRQGKLVDSRDTQLSGLAAIAQFRHVSVAFLALIPNQLKFEISQVVTRRISPTILH
jgi:hypothetical protein